MTSPTLPCDRGPPPRGRLAAGRHQRNGDGGRLIAAFSVGEDGISAFSDFGIENLIKLVGMYKDL